MKIQYISDIHLEFMENREFLFHMPIEPEGDVLILAGDIFSLRCIDPKVKKDAVTEEFIAKINKELFGFWQDNFDIVIQIAGNHEFYRYTIDSPATKEGYHYMMGENHHLVNECTIIHENVRFVCATMWTDAQPEIVDMLNDFYQIKGMTLESYNGLHDQAREWFDKELAKPFDGETVVVSHHIPSFNSISPKYVGNEMNSGFACTDMDMILSKHDIKYWIHGHSHDRFDVEMFDTKIIRNPLGYVHHGEHMGFHLNRVVEV